MLLGDTDQALQTLHAFRELGVEVAVDNFGTGYSSLAYLTLLPLNRLTIGLHLAMRVGFRRIDGSAVHRRVCRNDTHDLTLRDALRRVPTDAIVRL